MTHPLLEIRNLSVYYESIQALRGVNLHVDSGSIVSLIGANGAGKSTVLRSISGLKRPTEGDIFFHGQSLSGKEPHLRVKMGIVQCPEGRGIFPNLNVEENLDLGAYVRQDKPGNKKGPGSCLFPFSQALGKKGPIGRNPLRWGTANAGHWAGAHGAAPATLIG